MTVYSLHAEPIENGCGDSIGCRELRSQSFSATRLFGASEVRNASDIAKERWFAVGIYPPKIG